MIAVELTYMTVDAWSDGFGQFLVEHGGVSHVQDILLPSSCELQAKNVVVFGSRGGVDGRTEEGGAISRLMRESE